MGPGELPHVQNLGLSSSNSEKAKELTLRYLVWLEVRKLETHPLLLVPGWTGFNIKVCDRVIVAESTISYLDTVRDSWPYRAPLYPPVAGHVILRPCAFGSLMCVVLCVWAKSLLVPSPFTISMLTS